MKSTYQLIGVYLDHMPCEELPEHPARISSEVPELGSSECLFDAVGTRRYLRVSDLLACADLAGIDAIAARARDCSQLDILLDYTPAAGAAMGRFFKRRVGQAVAHVRGILPATRIRMVTLS